MIFWRILDNKVYGVDEVDRLGFAVDEGLRIPDEYLDDKNFIVMRSCHGLGDWGIISAMPRLLKEKYPSCKVYVPSSKLLQNLFGEANDWQSWSNPYQHAENVFKNNPYVDNFIDSFEGDIYHDHYRIYDLDNPNVPMVKQMLKFWQFKDNEMIDTTPDFYPSLDEEEWFKNFNKSSGYGYISASSTFGDTAEPDVMLDKIKAHDKDMVWYYYGEVPIEESHFSFLKNVIEVKLLDLTIRQQQMLKIEADVNYGNETGMNLWTAKHSKTYILNNKTYGPIHGSNRERKRPFKSGNFVEGITYL